MAIAETINRDGLIVGEATRNATITLESGQNLARGAVLGRKTTGGKYVLSLSAASDGSQVPLAILSEAVDASSGDKPCQAYFAGEFDGDKLVYGASHTAATVEAAFRGQSAPIFIRTRL